MLEHQKIRPYSPTSMISELENIRTNRYTLFEEFKNDFRVNQNITNPITKQQYQSPPFQYFKNIQQPKMIVSMSLQQVFQLNEQLQKDNKKLKVQNELIEADYQQIKNGYFKEKQRAKQFSIDLEFNEGIYLSILRDVLKGVEKNEINRKVQKEIRGYKMEYPKYCDNGLMQAIQMVNQKGAFQPLSNNFIQNQEHTNQLNRKKSSNKQQQKCKICIAYQEDIQKFKKQLEIRNRQNTQLKLTLTELNNEILTLTAQNTKKQMDIERYQTQVKNLDEEIEQITILNEKLTTRIINQDIKQNKKEEQRLSQLITKQKEHNTWLQSQNHKQKQYITILEKEKGQYINFRQNKEKKLYGEIQHLSQILSSEKQHYELQLASIKKYNMQLQKQLRQNLQELNTFKRNTEYNRVCTLKMNQKLEHLWKVKEIQFENLAGYLKQLKDNQ